jgi:hypothetical protein
MPITNTIRMTKDRKTRILRREAISAPPSAPLSG